MKESNFLDTDKEKKTSKIAHMMQLKLTLGQVLAGLAVTTSATISTLLFANNYFQSKADAVRDYAFLDQRIVKLESAFLEQARIQTQIAVDVSYIKGRLEPQNGK